LGRNSVQVIARITSDNVYYVSQDTQVSFLQRLFFREQVPRAISS